MTVKPANAHGYRRDHVELARSACLHIATIVGDIAGDIVVVGGLVPSLIVDQRHLPEGAEPHAGTMDLDLGLALAVLDNERYQTLAERLRVAGQGRVLPDRRTGRRHPGGSCRLCRQVAGIMRSSLILQILKA